MPNNPKTYREKYFTIDYISGRKKSRYRLRYKGLKSLGFAVGAGLDKAEYFEHKNEALKHAKDEISTIQATGQLVEDLTPQEKAHILREAAEIKSKGLDPIEVMREGTKSFSMNQKDLKKPIGDFWKEYYEKRADQGRWGTRHQTLQRQFYNDTLDGFMTFPVKSFRSEKEGIKAVRETLEAWVNNDRRSVNSVRAAKSKMSCFLQYVASETDVINTATIKAIFSKGRDLDPPRLIPEQENSRLDPLQAEYLIQCMSEQKCAAWIVLKLFMGARTELLQKWRWSIVEWNNKRIRIPQKLTKNKKEDVVFDFDEIPNFEDWIVWAWEKEGKPAPAKMICNNSQPTITNRVKKAMNANKKLFVDDGRKKLCPVETHRNFMRSAFISFGLERLGITTVIRVAEDRHNLDKYLKMDGKRSMSVEAKYYWSLTPKSVFADAIPNTSPPEELKNN